MRTQARAGPSRPALLVLALAVVAAGCYSTSYRRGIEVNVALLSELSDKLADYCRADFRLDGRQVSSEEMGEFYYALMKARSYATMTSGAAGKPSYQAFRLLLDDYGNFLSAADRYRLSPAPDPGQLASLKGAHAAVKRQAQAVLEALRAEP